MLARTFAAADEWETFGSNKAPVKKVAKLGSKKLGGKLKLAKPQATEREVAASEPEPEPEPEPRPASEQQDGDGWDDDGDGWPQDDEVAAVDEPATAAEAEAARQDRLDKLALPEAAPEEEPATQQETAPQEEPAAVAASDDFADAPDIPDDFDDAPDFDDDF